MPRENAARLGDQLSDSNLVTLPSSPRCRDTRPLTSTRPVEPGSGARKEREGALGWLRPVPWRGERGGPSTGRPPCRDRAAEALLPLAACRGLALPLQSPEAAAGRGEASRHSSQSPADTQGRGRAQGPRCPATRAASQSPSESARHSPFPQVALATSDRTQPASCPLSDWDPSRRALPSQQGTPIPGGPALAPQPLTPKATGSSRSPSSLESGRGARPPQPEPWPGAPGLLPARPHAPCSAPSSRLNTCDINGDS